MSTTKTIKIQKNKILTYGINKSGFQTVNKTLVVTEDTIINEELTATSNAEILNLGDRIFDCATFFMYFTPSGSYDLDSLKYITASQTSGIGLTNIQVNKNLWLAQVETALSIETPKGSSNTFIFTYNGSTWDLTGTVTVSGISATDLGDVYGISFTGTATNGDIITVVETQYNKFACYVLDSNYRFNSLWSPSSERIFSVSYDNTTCYNCNESSTYYNEYVWNNLNPATYPIFNTCKNKGNFILPNNIIVKALLPNVPELKVICDNKVLLDQNDPIQQAAGSTAPFNLTNWNFGHDCVWSCQEPVNWARNAFYMYSAANISGNNDGWKKYDLNAGCIPIFEVPVM